MIYKFCYLNRFSWNKRKIFFLVKMFGGSHETGNQWSDTEYNIAHVKEELADVLVYCRNMLDKLDLNEDEIVNEKMSKNEAKYPVNKARGKADKYDKL